MMGEGSRREAQYRHELTTFTAEPGAQACAFVPKLFDELTRF